MARRIRFLGPGAWLDRLLNRNLPADRRITLHVAWPLYLFPWLLTLQLIDPSPLWMALMATLLGIYAAGLAWVRVQARGLSLSRRRLGAMIVVGDSVSEEFTLENPSPLPLLWAAFADESYLPGYTPGQVASCGAEATVRWKSEAICRQRGVFRLGPHSLHSGDPFGLFRLHLRSDQQESLLVYPRVVHLPPVDLPRGQTSGRDRRRRPLHGDLRSPSVRFYQPGDSLRRIHWPTTAHRGQLMVSELEEGPSGDLWIVLDLNSAAHSGTGESSTLETGVILAASLAADLLGSNERRSVGLLTVGRLPTDDSGDHKETVADQTILLSPQPGRGHLWRLLAALAPIQAGRLPVADLLQRNRLFLGKGHTVVVITPQIDGAAPDWIAQLLHLRRSGVDSSVLAVTPATDDINGAAHVLAAQQDRLSDLLVRQEIPVRFLQAGTPLRAALTYRRRRTELRTTPTGGVIAREVEEEVG